MKPQLFNLVRMELYSAKRSLMWYFLVPVIYPTLIRYQGNLSALSYLVTIALIGYILCTGFAQSDEKYKTGIMLNTLPVKRNDIINARFVSLYLVYAAVTLVFILTEIVEHWAAPNLYGAMNFSVIPAGILFVSLFNGVQIPLYYIFDIRKSAILCIIILAVLFGLIVHLLELTWIDAILAQMDTVLINISMLIVATFIYLIASTISKIIYRHKEF
ncbi:MAG: ABC-2 transporter permease [Sporolactobacillus sp.]